MEKIINLTIQQQKAVEEQEIALLTLRDLYHTGERELVLAGVGGTGKTQLAMRLVEMLRNDYYNMHIPFKGGEVLKYKKLAIQGAAISHGAKNVLADRFEEGEVFDVHFYTIAALLRLRRRVTNAGKIVFEPEHKEIRAGTVKIYPPIKDGDLIFIDECSQISDETKAMIDKEKGPNTVIIYLGDWHQTPPVSKTREPDSDSSTFNLPGVQLVTPFRYEGDIEELASAIAGEIDKLGEKSLKFLNKFATVTGKDYEFTRNGEEFFDAFLEDNASSDNLKHCVLINYRKKVTKALAKELRDKVVENSKDKFVAGEKIVCKRGTKGTTDALSLTNHKVFRINRVKEAEAMMKFKFGNYVKIQIADSITEAAESKEKGVVFKRIPIYLLDLVDSNGAVFNNIAVLKDELNMNYIMQRNWMKGRAERELQSRYWSEYFTFLEFFNEFDYGYAVNTYVVQGDTYNNVYINLRDIMSVGPITTREKLQSLYTAVTRARKKVKILV